MDGFDLGLLVGWLTAGPTLLWIGYILGGRHKRAHLPPLDDSYRRPASQIKGRW